MTLPIKIKTWLNARGISDSVIASHKLDWNGNQIMIPVNDLDGNFLFNKYRRNPFGADDVPKYRYEKGSTAQLFNGDEIKSSGIVFVLEGEMDAMRLESEFFSTVSTTGGAGTWKDEWTSLLKDKQIYIAYDNDDAGIQGAVKLLTKLPGARMIMIPKEEGVKDVTDFLKKYKTEHFRHLISLAEEFPFLSAQLPEFKTIKSIQEQIKIFRGYIMEMSNKEKKMMRLENPWRHYKAIIALLLVGIKNLEREIKKRQYKGPTKNSGSNADDVKRAKEVPIEFLYQGKLVKKGNRATGPCPFHKEKHSSFVIYLDQNSFFCYGCGAGGDVIDYLCRKDNLKFFEAVKKLCSQPYI